MSALEEMRPRDGEPSGQGAVPFDLWTGACEPKAPQPQRAVISAPDLSGAGV